MKRTALYRHLDGKGRLLYVGISATAMARQAAHQFGSPWFDKVRRIDLEWFGTRDEAHAAERKAIRSENPLHNKERYLEPTIIAALPVEVPVHEFGTVYLTDRAADRIIDILCCPTHAFDTVEGIAANFRVPADYLAQFVAFPEGEGVRPGKDDLFAITDRIVRGTLAIEAPWVFGSKLPLHITHSDSVPPPLRGPSHSVPATAVRCSA